MTALSAKADALLAAYKRRPRDVRLALFTGAALLEEGQTEKALAVWSIGDDVNRAMTRVKDNPKTDPEIRRMSALADRSLREHFLALHRAAVEQISQAEGAPLDRILSAIWTQTHVEKVHFRTRFQQPTIFYVPDLPAFAVTPHDHIPWRTGVEAAFMDILEEYQRAQLNGIAENPYVPGDTSMPEWRNLRGSLDWSSLHLWKNSKPTAALRAFPKTVAALSGADLLRVDGAPMEAFFSKLRPGAHIPPHYGLTNARLTVHLPLITPPDCAIRVGDNLHQWKRGEIIAFDDSFEHEAWNKSNTDRVVLIFECHHPDLSGAERRAIENAFSVRQNWLNRRYEAAGLR